MYQLIVNTDHNISGGAPLAAEIQTKLQKRIDRFSKQLTRVEVHIEDQNAKKSGINDILCKLEVRPAGLRPLVVTHRSKSVAIAVDLACRKMEKMLSHTMGRLHDQRG
jgi:ribosome-associated translation inhibitor RaiA